LKLTSFQKFKNFLPKPYISWVIKFLPRKLLVKKIAWDVETYVFLENLIIFGRNRTFHGLLLKLTSFQKFKNFLPKPYISWVIKYLPRKLLVKKIAWDVETYVFLENLIIFGRNRTFHGLLLKLTSFQKFKNFLPKPYISWVIKVLEKPRKLLVKKIAWDVETYVFLENLIISGRNRTFHGL
jgi:hypothetical protein